VSFARDRARALLAKYKGKSLSRMSERDRKEWTALRRYFETIGHRRRNPRMRERHFYRVAADVGGRFLHDTVPASNIQQAVRVAMSRWRHAGHRPNEASVRARRQNPRGGRFDRCVMEVKRRGGAKNPYAVCNAALRKNPRDVWEKYGTYWRAVSEKYGPVKITRSPWGRGKFKYHLLTDPWTGDPVGLGEFDSMVAAKAAAGTVRGHNPRSRYHRSHGSRVTHPHMFSLIAQREGHKRLVYTGSKFSEGGRPVLFKTREHAATVAKFLRAKFHVLRGYRFYTKEV